MDVMSQLEGAYALLIKSTHYPEEVLACSGVHRSTSSWEGC